MTDFSKIIEKAKELEAKMKESQEKIRNIRVEGISGYNSSSFFITKATFFTLFIICIFTKII